MKKCILVTGSSRGIGKAIAIELAEFKVPIIINYNSNKDEALIVKKLIEDKGTEAHIYQCNVSDKQAVSEMLRWIKEQGLFVKVLVNNAGIARDGLFSFLSETDWEDVVSVNLNSCFYMSKKVVPSMIAKGGGVIVNVSSVAGMRGMIGQSNYAASKAGIISLTRSMARELSPKIRVNCVAPGFVDTDILKGIKKNPKMSEMLEYAKENMIPNKRFGQPEEIAKAVRFLVSKDSSYISGHILVVDGGLSI